MRTLGTLASHMPAWGGARWSAMRWEADLRLGRMEPVDPRDLRISDADRHRVAEVLREAAGEGRLDLDELEERLEGAYGAKTYRDLIPLTADLPAQQQGPHLPGRLPPPPVPEGPRPAYRPLVGHAPVYLTSVAVMSECRRVGVWETGVSHTATAFMGSVLLDLRQAVLPAGGLVIHANVLMGSVRVVVDARTAVVIEGNALMGIYAETGSRVPARIDAGSPVLRVRGVALMGSVEVRRKGPPGELRRRLLGQDGP